MTRNPLRGVPVGQFYRGWTFFPWFRIYRHYLASDQLVPGNMVAVPIRGLAE